MGGRKLVELLCLLSFATEWSTASSLRIIGGVPATRGEFPWMLSLQYKFSSTEGSHICGATLLNTTHAVTAGHCLMVDNDEVFPVELIQVKAGVHNMQENESTQQRRDVIRITIHPEYENMARTRHDVAVIEIDPPLEMTAFVGSIPLAPMNHVVDGQCWIAGWGQTADTMHSDILLKTSVPIVHKESCKNIYGNRLDERNQICAGYANGGSDFCVGDTGGGLICSDIGSNYLAGIASWGFKCALPNYPGVYTEASVYITDFIN